MYAYGSADCACSSLTHSGLFVLSLHYQKASDCSQSSIFSTNRWVSKCILYTIECFERTVSAAPVNDWNQSLICQVFAPIVDIWRHAFEFVINPRLDVLYVTDWWFLNILLVSAIGRWSADISAVRRSLRIPRATSRVPIDLVTFSNATLQF